MVKTTVKHLPLRRYTNLAQALYILREQKITLMDPNNWDDKNDSMFLNEYKIKRKAKVVAALCFASGGETYHHWGIFSKGNDGICISFDRAKLVSRFKGERGVRFGSVKYKTFDQMRESPAQIVDLPFLKRHGYSDENEFRILYESEEAGSNYPAFSIDLSCITRITVSPWLHETYFPEVKRALKNTGIPTKIPIQRSTLIGSRTWQEFALSAR